MTIREELELREKEILAPWAAFSRQSRGRRFAEEQCDIRPVFQRDRDRILHCKSFRRLKDKTQVFITPDGDHYRTRLTHTLEVSQNARTIAKALHLNEDLTEAIALGHDLGHTPFGHAGERVLNRLYAEGFDHAEQSLRTVDVLEKNGQGLNLTFEVRDGIVNHQTKGNPCTLEGQVVRLSDKIAYFHHDMDDAIRGGILTEDDVPEEIADVLGHTLNDRLDHFIHDIITASAGRQEIRMSEETGAAMKKLRAFMFERVYTNPAAKGEEKKAEQLVETLFYYYVQSDHTDQLPDYLRELMACGDSRERVVCDYISSMTDRFAIARYKELYVPNTWQ
ncbi:deoxyguanosinetriphosphate triphosphohydrolase [Lachnoclostridium sp. Marseille-P6806]|uniref:deoxyguanosinetriphosphate triphosphohydrolase n=1 Tax=Lachnoclostridium sp. Marseille-P6806 TaxID=2364793 RepID=UPI00103198D7|nr:deoxyguanosinetriphosphate triphosphohydrolase [Lachnoclostridium sp. Marseille-P6806]